MKLKNLKSKKKVMLSSLLALFAVAIIGFSNSYQVKAEDDVQQYALGCIPDSESVLEDLHKLNLEDMVFDYAGEFVDRMMEESEQIRNAITEPLA